MKDNGAAVYHIKRQRGALAPYRHRAEAAQNPIPIHRQSFPLPLDIQSPALVDIIPSSEPSLSLPPFPPPPLQAQDAAKRVQSPTEHAPAPTLSAPVLTLSAPAPILSAPARPRVRLILPPGGNSPPELPSHPKSVPIPSLSDSPVSISSSRNPFSEPSSPLSSLPTSRSPSRPSAPLPVTLPLHRPTNGSKPAKVNSTHSLSAQIQEPLRRSLSPRPSLPLPALPPQRDTSLIPRRRESKIRGHQMRMAWFESRGESKIPYPPICPSAQHTDLFLHRFGDEHQVWIMGTDKLWNLIAAGYPHPILKDHQLWVTLTDSPRWLSRSWSTRKPQMKKRR